METLNHNFLSFPAKTFAKALALLGVTLAVTACGNGGGGSAAPVPPVYGNGCYNCAGSIPSPVVLTTFKAQSFDGAVSLVNVQVYAQGTAIVPNASGNNYKWYAGPIAAQGQLVVTTPQYDISPYTGQRASACALPAGTFNLQTSSVGQMGQNGVDVYLSSLVTVGAGIELKVEAPSPMGFLDGGQTLWAKVSVVRVNGIPCSADFFGEFK